MNAWGQPLGEAFSLESWSSGLTIIDIDYIDSDEEDQENIEQLETDTDEGGRTKRTVATSRI